MLSSTSRESNWERIILVAHVALFQCVRRVKTAQPGSTNAVGHLLGVFQALC